MVQKRFSALCWKRGEVSERELIHPRGSPSWTPELSKGSDPGGAAVQQSCFVNQEAKGRMEMTACRLHRPLHHCRYDDTERKQCHHSKMQTQEKFYLLSFITYFTK